VIILFVAFTYAELGAMFPESGGACAMDIIRTARWSGLSRMGRLDRHCLGDPGEAEASVQYMSSWPWSWRSNLYVHAANGQEKLSAAGLFHFRRTRGALFLVNFLERKGFCRYQQRHYLFPADRAGGDCRGADVFRLPLAELPSGHSRRPACRKRRCHSDRGRHQRIVFSYNGFQSPVTWRARPATRGASVPSPSSGRSR